MSVIGCMFVDDTSLFKYVKHNIQQAVTTENKDLDIMHKWSIAWLVSVDPSKTVFMLFSNQMSSFLVQPIYYGIISLQQFEPHKHLGLILNLNLFWSKHISAAIAKSN